MSNAFGFDFDGIEEESNSFSLMPEGEYTLVVESAELKTTKSGTGKYINFKYKVVSPEKFNKRFVWDIVNVKNDNPKAVEIGMGRLKRMLSIAGFSTAEMKTKSQDDLVGKLMGAWIKHETSTGYDAREKISALNAPKENGGIVADKKEVPSAWL